MPNLDGTGPNGQGLRTGRKQSTCVNSSNQLRNTPLGGLGKGLRNSSVQNRGLGRRLRNGSGQGRDLNK